MIFFEYLWLTFMLFVLPISAAEATETTAADDSTATSTSLLKIWDVDKSCKDELEYMEDSMSIALDIVTAAHSALKFVAHRRPNYDTDPDGYNRWTAIYKTCRGFFGFALEKETNHLEYVTALYDKIMRTIPADENNPANGYVYELRDLPNAKPKIMCGDEAGEEKWKWYSMSDKLPGQSRALADMPEFEGYGFELAGAWFYDHRFVWKQDIKGKPIICSRISLGMTLWDKDIIVFCSDLFSAYAKALKSPREWKASGIVDGALLTDYHQDHLSTVMVHELCHWFGDVVRDRRGVPAPSKILASFID
ncbi:hypothetical protein IL306_004936 [Fusarium sp. DS 682]|nr:hypothetical protein IL306_004936 [Fusarium sp. DS 682]